MKLKPIIIAIIICVSLSSCICMDVVDEVYYSSTTKNNKNKTVNHAVANPVTSEVAAE